MSPLASTTMPRTNRPPTEAPTQKTNPFERTLDRLVADPDLQRDSTRTLEDLRNPGGE